MQRNIPSISALPLLQHVPFCLYRRIGPLRTMSSTHKQTDESSLEQQMLRFSIGGIQIGTLAGYSATLAGLSSKEGRDSLMRYSWRYLQSHAQAPTAPKTTPAIKMLLYDPEGTHFRKVITAGCSFLQEQRKACAPGSRGYRLGGFGRYMAEHVDGPDCTNFKQKGYLQHDAFDDLLSGFVPAAEAAEASAERLSDVTGVSITHSPHTSDMDMGQVGALVGWTGGDANMADDYDTFAGFSPSVPTPTTSATGTADISGWSIETKPVATPDIKQNAVYIQWTDTTGPVSPSEPSTVPATWPDPHGRHDTSSSFSATFPFTGTDDNGLIPPARPDPLKHTGHNRHAMPSLPATSMAADPSGANAIIPPDPHPDTEMEEDDSCIVVCTAPRDEQPPQPKRKYTKRAQTRKADDAAKPSAKASDATRSSESTPSQTSDITLSGAVADPNGGTGVAARPGIEACPTWPVRERIMGQSGQPKGRELGYQPRLASIRRMKTSAGSASGPDAGT